MTQTEFIDKVRQAYIVARDFLYQPITNQQVLTRGTSHSISSVTEDLFGCYCTEKITNAGNIKVYIDPQLSFSGTNLKNKNNKRPLLVRPDLAIANDNVIQCMFDIKTDLGYKRIELYNHAKERNDQINLIKKSVAKYYDGKTKVQKHLTFSEDTKFIYVVISQGNIKKSVQDDFISRIRQLDKVEIYQLSTGDHLNAYHDNPNWQINKTDFDNLDKKILECLIEQ
ncbi:hypothetical protein [Emticicia sp. W12TSBA100-4]|uniref:hypothetical protein n=1 Tax=Emticicia sp. W12TSBA100-4 TaxID=3160965 RepID=UPI003305ED02